MKTNPPANSNSPTSRKKPRIICHPLFPAPRTPSANTGAAGEIQPHQHLIGAQGPDFPVPEQSESVDAAKRALYKTGNGGGRNPAAAIL
jgi:hypothetical protein